MATATKTISEKRYSAEDHGTWARYFARQKALVKDMACKEFQEGFRKLKLDAKRVPGRQEVSGRLRKMTGWTLSGAGNKNVSIEEWFAAMRKRSFPVTDYIRPAKDFDYTANPDLLHEYFGHLPFLTDKKFAKLAQEFGAMCRKANRRQLVQISRLWSLAVEFGLIREKGKIKLFGAGLLSSYGETLHAKQMIRKGNVEAFDAKKIMATPGRTYEMHRVYFVMNSMQDITDALHAYGKKEKLI